MRCWCFANDYYFACWRHAKAWMRTDEGRKAMAHYINPKMKRAKRPW